jgi:NADPH:quinone reductase-like Zn-dependent oxidoreductase
MREICSFPSSEPRKERGQVRSDLPYSFCLYPQKRKIVVTGATSGIGYEFAHQLAQAGFNVFLVSRDPSKLAQVAGEIGTWLCDPCFDYNRLTQRSRKQEPWRQDSNTCP